MERLAGYGTLALVRACHPLSRNDPRAVLFRTRPTGYKRFSGKDGKENRRDTMHDSTAADWGSMRTAGCRRDFLCDGGRADLPNPLAGWIQEKAEL